MIEIEKLIKTLTAYFEQHPPDYGDAESVLDMIYWHYTEYNPIGTRKTKELFANLRGALSCLSDQDYDKVFDIVSDICIEHERLAFIEGLRLSVVLLQEICRK